MGTPSAPQSRRQARLGIAAGAAIHLVEDAFRPTLFIPEDNDHTIRSRALQILPEPRQFRPRAIIPDRQFFLPAEQGTQNTAGAHDTQSQEGIRHSDCPANNPPDAPDGRTRRRLAADEALDEIRRAADDGAPHLLRGPGSLKRGLRTLYCQALFGFQDILNPILGCVTQGCEDTSKTTFLCPGLECIARDEGRDYAGFPGPR